MKALSEHRIWSITVDRDGDDWPDVRASSHIRIFPDKAVVKFTDNDSPDLAKSLISVTVSGPYQNQSVQHSTHRSVQLRASVAVQVFGTLWLHNVQMAAYATERTPMTDTPGPNLTRHLSAVPRTLPGGSPSLAEVEWFAKFMGEVTSNLSSLNEIMTEVVRALAEHEWSDPEFAELTRLTLQRHTHALGYTFQGDGPGGQVT